MSVTQTFQLRVLEYEEQTMKLSINRRRNWDRVREDDFYYPTSEEGGSTLPVHLYLNVRCPQRIFHAKAPLSRSENFYRRQPKIPSIDHANLFILITDNSHLHKHGGKVTSLWLSSTAASDIWLTNKSRGFLIN